MSTDNTESAVAETRDAKPVPTSTVGRGKTVTLETTPESERFDDGDVSLFLGNSNLYLDVSVMPRTPTTAAPKETP